MIKRNSPPENILPGDIILIVKEEEKYHGLVYSKFQVLEIDVLRKEDRVIKPGLFNGNPVRHLNDLTEDYWTKMDFVQVEKRTIDGYDIYYETILSKEMEKPSGDSGVDWLMDLLD